MLKISKNIGTLKYKISNDFLPLTRESLMATNFGKFLFKYVPFMKKYQPPKSIATYI